MELRVSAVDVKLFGVYANSKSLIAEASELREHNLMQRLYDDAADAGFGMWNEKTNAVTRWYYGEDKRDKEGEITVTLFYPTTETLRKHPQLTGWVVHVLND